MKQEFADLGDEIDTKSRRNVEKACLVVERAAKLKFLGRRPKGKEIWGNPGGGPPHVDTGRLRASITHRVEKTTGEIAGYVGTNVEYAAAVEFGTSKSAPYPYLFPALDESSAEIDAALEDFS